LTLVVMAAGLGKRFGGPKQLEPVGPSGETLIDYALFDGHRAGFDRAVLVIRDELTARIQPIVDRHAHRLPISLAHQVAVRHRPRGTVPAVLAAAGLIDGPFSALNADDFYGDVAYRLASAFLRDERVAADTHAVIAFALRRTLSPHGGVVRGVCETAGGALIRLEEVRGIEWQGATIAAGDRRFSGNEQVSMNFWAFQRAMLTELQRELEHYSRDHDSHDELLLPVTIDALVAEGRAKVRVLDAPGPWLGLTHTSDLPALRQALREAAERDEYRTPVWKQGNV
jgi:NDP-sugar pyrophosphorylase family protein